MASSNRECKRLIAVFTESVWDEWALADRIAQSNNQADILSWDIAQNRLIPYDGVEPCVLCFKMQSHLFALVREDLSSFTKDHRKIDDLVYRFIENAACAENYLAIHSLDKFVWDKKAVEKKSTALANFHHTRDYEELFTALLRLLNAIECGDADIVKHYGELQSVIIKLAGQIQINKVSVLKHKIVNCLLPLDIDLQGWPESDFDAEYGCEIRDTYIGKSPTPVEHARNQLYEGAYNLDIVVKKRSAEIDSAKKCIAGLLPKKRFDSSNILFKDASIIINELEAGNMDNVKRRLEIANPFHAWLAALMSALDNLRDALENHHE